MGSQAMARSLTMLLLPMSLAVATLMLHGCGESDEDDGSSGGGDGKSLPSSLTCAGGCTLSVTCNSAKDEYEITRANTCVLPTATGATDWKYPGTFTMSGATCAEVDAGYGTDPTEDCFADG